MSFYSQLSRHYDEIFTVNAAELRFAAELLRGRERLLDVGCGTGNKTVFLADGKAEVAAFDLDAGMIEQAQRKHSRPNIRYRTLNMLRIAETFPPGSFDAVTCLGNTIAHLTGADDLARFMRQTAQTLRTGGVLVLQALNYDRILDRKIAALPRIETEHVVFDRSYEWKDGEMHFVTGLNLKDTGETLSNDIVLRPVRKAELAGDMAAAGFDRSEYYGSYQGDAFTEDSFHLIVRAEKGSE